MIENGEKLELSDRSTTLALADTLRKAAQENIQRKTKALPVARPTTHFQAGSIPALLELDGNYDEHGSFRPHPGQKLRILEPRITEVFWCRFTDTIIPEFGKLRPVVIVSKKNPLGTFSLVVPMTTSKENVSESTAIKLSSNPNPNSDVDVWALPTHVYAASHWRLLRFMDNRTKALVTPKIDQEDFDRIVSMLMLNLPTTRSA
jgi:uncharacterized protein YifN (PemK superfamily)